jgi:TorA maturation chaperone TorD/ferredoxin-like protein FixX
MLTARGALYAALAEVLAEPPVWLALPGQEWPLYAALLPLRDRSPAAAAAVPRLALIPAEPIAARRARYRALSAGDGRPRFWFYESMHRSGCLLGQESVAVERLYRAAGLEIAGGELPDHASLELAFLAHLVEQQATQPGQEGRWRRLERAFLRKHASRWLPDLGRGLAAADDAVYAPIGRLLAGWLTEAAGRRPARGRSKPASRPLPVITQAEACTLCGFCAQVCPSRALVMRETDDETSLQLFPADCSGCARCERICRQGALHLQARPAASTTVAVLRRSPRATCPHCGVPTASYAELNYVIDQVGRVPWLTSCPDCRVRQME